MKTKRAQNKMGLSAALLALAIVAILFTTPGAAIAQRRWHGDIHHFHERDFVRWRGGHWVHGWHYRRFGWWWVVPWGWYSYPAPVYPYPDPYIPPAVAVQPGPPAVAQVQPQARTWYYCDSSGGYYPYVPECSSGWRAVPAAPAPPTPSAPPAPYAQPGPPTPYGQPGPPMSPSAPPPPPPNRY